MTSVFEWWTPREGERMPETKQVVDLVGSKFNRLLVISKYGRINRHMFWNCVCDCGALHKVRQHNLTHNKTKSCGCLKKEVDDIRYAEARISKEEFLRRSMLMHGGKYDYSKVEYNNTKSEVEIICNEHGSFWQIPFVHWRNSGCPQCALKRFERKKDGK